MDSQNKTENRDYYLYNENYKASYEFLTFKQKMFNFCCTFTPISFLSPMGAATLMLISFFQIYGLMLAMNYTDDASGEILLRLLQSFRLLPEIEVLKSSFLYFFCIILVCIILVALCINAILNSILHSTSYIAGLFPIIYWGCLIPVTELLVSIWECNSDGNHNIAPEIVCWSGIHIAVMAFAGIISLIWLAISVLSILIISYSQPFSHDPFAHFPWNFELLFILLRIAFILNVRLIRSEYGQVALIVMVMLNSLGSIWNSYPYYDPTVSCVFSGCSAGVVSCSVFILLKYILNGLDIHTDGITILTILTITILFMLLWWSQKRWYNNLLVSTKLHTVYETDMKIYMLINILIKGTIYTKAQIKYLESCNSSFTNAKESNPIDYQVSMDSINTFTLVQMPSTVKGINSEGENSRLINLIRNCEKENIGNTNNVQYLFQMSGVALFIMQNTHMAYTKILEAEAFDPGLTVDFAVHLRKLEILSAIKIQKEKTMRKLGYCRFQSVIQFEAEYQNLQKKMNQQANIRLDFWSTLRTKPSLNKLHKLGMEMIKLNIEVKKSWEILNSIYSKNVPILRLYKAYMKYIIGDNEEISAAKRLIKCAATELEYKPLSVSGLFIEKVGTIIISPDSKIIKVNKATEKIFLYNKRQLCGNPITIIMPPLIGKHHSKFMDTYYKTGVEPSGGRQFLTFGLDREGFIFPIKVAKQQFFSLSHGMLYIGTIEVQQQYKEEQYILTDHVGQIGGITKQICRRLRITPFLIADKKLNITKVCPQLNENEIRNLSGERNLGFTYYPIASKTSYKKNTNGRNLMLPENKSYEFNASPLPPLRLQYNTQISNTSEKSSASANEKESQPGPEIQPMVPCRKGRVVDFRVKCEITSTEYSAGVVMKIVKVGKAVREGGEHDKKKKTLIGSDVASSVSAILRTIRKFKLVLAKKKERLLKGNARSPRLVSESSFRKLNSNRFNIPRNSMIQEEIKGQVTLLRKLFPSPSSVSIDSPNNTSDATVSKSRIAMNDNSGLNLLGGNSLVKQHRIPIKEASQKLVRIDEVKNTLAMPTKTKDVKEISETRKKRIEDFNPDNIKYMKITNEIFIVLVLILLAVRMAISIQLNTDVVNYSPLMKSNGDRQCTFTTLGVSSQMLSLYYPYKGTNTSLIDMELRESLFDYGKIMKVLKLGNGTSYKDYLLARLIFDLPMLKKAQIDIDHAAVGYNPSFVELINPPNVPILCTINDQYLNFTESIQSSLNTVIALQYKMIDTILKGTYSNEGYIKDAIANNVMGSIIKAIRPSLDSIVTAAYEKITLHETFSTGALISLIGIYVLYFLILIPFLFFARKDLSAMLILLLDIPKPEIIEEHGKALLFLKKLYKDDKSRLKNVSLNEVESANEEEEKEPGEGDNFRKTDFQGRQVDEEQFNDNEKNENNNLVSVHKKEIRNRRSYIEYKSNVWEVLFIFGMFSSFAIGIYSVLDYFSKSATVVATFKITELRHLSRNLYANSFSIPYLYLYILSNKTGNCALSTCASYLSTYFPFRLEELNTMLIMHKGNVSLLNKGYETLYNNIFENNPCEKTEMKNFPNCSTIMGGSFTKGAFIANVVFADVAFSVYRDFEKSNGSLANIKKYANDPRMVSLEILDTMFLSPALFLMVDYIMKELPIELRDAITLIVSLLSLFIIVFVASTTWWLKWLIGFMRRSMFDTESLLSNLPDDVIMRNETIYRHLAKKSLKANPNPKNN